MKRAYLVLSIAVLCISGWSFGRYVSAEADAVSVSPHLVISQFQAGGGSATDEFIEIKNTSSTPIDLSGYIVVYRSQNGTDDGSPMASWAVSTILDPGKFYLIAAQGSYDGGAAADKTYDPTTRSMSASNGGLAIRQGSVNTGAIIDSVAWGTVTNGFAEWATTTAPANNNSQIRKDSGCQDTDNNSSDFQGQVPSSPRNSATAAVTCSGGGTELFAAINANPTSVSPGASTLLTVTVIPATTPPSTGITVSGNLTAIGGAATQAFFDNGTNGDVTPSDNVFSYSAIIPGGTTGGVKNVTALAADAQARLVNLNINITVNAPLPNDDPLLLGNPSNATANVANENNYLMQKPQYTLSYNRSKATPNWVAWRLDSSWIGSAQRQDDYRPDPALPAGWYQVVDADYSGSGYTRGHMTPSGDRTRSVADNSATFLMTNFVPQTAENNSGPWEEFESYCRTLANAGNEIYIVTGPVGNIGTIADGRIVIPQYTWKVVLIIPNGDNDLQRIGKGTRAFGLVVPNFPPLDINAPWRNFRVTVDQVEHLTGYDFFNALGVNKQMLIERRRDRS
jgi:endonuclease G